MAASPDGAYVAAGGGSGRVYLWHAPSGELVRAWPAHYKAACALAFSPCGTGLASGGADGGVHVWDVAAAVDLPGLGDLSAYGARWH